MPKNPYSSAHFLPKIDGTTRHSNCRDDNQDMSRTPEILNQGRLAASNGTSKTFGSQRLSLDRAQATNRVINLISASPNLEGVSLQQDREDGIVRGSDAWDSNFTQQRLVDGLSHRAQTRDITDVSTTVSLQEAQNMLSHSRIDESKRHVVSGLRKPRFDRHAYRRLDSSLRSWNPHSDERKPTLEVCFISEDARPVSKANQNTNTKLPSYHKQPYTSNKYQSSHIQIIDNSTIPQGLSEVSSETHCRTTVNTLYHDFIKEVSHAQSEQNRSIQHSTQNTVENSTMLEPADSASFNDDLITLPEFTVDPCDLASLSRSESMDRQMNPPDQAQSNEIDSGLLYNLILQPSVTEDQPTHRLTGRRKLGQHIPQTIDFEDSLRSYSQRHFQTPRHPPLTPPKTPESSRNFHFSQPSFSGVQNPKPCLSSSLNSSHQHNLLMLRGNDPYQLSSPPTSLGKSAQIMTNSPAQTSSSPGSEADIHVNDDRKSNTFYAYDLPSLSNLSDLSLTLSTISETHTASTARSKQKGLLESVILAISKHSSPSNTSQPTIPNVLSPHSRTASEESNKSLDPTSPSPSLDHEFLHSSTFPTAPALDLNSTLRDPYSSPAVDSRKEHTRRVSMGSIYEPCPPPLPIPRSRPVPRLLHPAPWLEDGKSLQGKLEGLLGSTGSSWTEVWAAHDDDDSKRGSSRQKSRMKNGLRKVLSRL